MVIWENARIGLCVVCSAPIQNPSVFVCSNCLKPCKGKEVGPRSFAPDGKAFVSDWKSECCNVDVIVNNKNTCSGGCHEILVQELEHSFGQYKQVIDINSGLTHKVPTRDIIERGLSYRDLKGYPIWVDGP